MIWKLALAAISGGLTVLALAAPTSSAYAGSGIPEVSVCGSPVTATINTADTAEAYRSFVGVWTGEWSRGRICSGLVVKKVDANGTTYVDYLYRPIGQNSTNINTQSIIGHIDNNATLTFNDRDGSRFTFMLRPEKDMAANFANAGGTRLEAVFRQASRPTSLASKLDNAVAAKEPQTTSTTILPIREGRYSATNVPCESAPMSVSNVIYSGVPAYSPQYGECKPRITQKSPDICIISATCTNGGPDDPPINTYTITTSTEYLVESKYGKERMRWCSDNKAVAGNPAPPSSPAIDPGGGRGSAATATADIPLGSFPQGRYIGIPNARAAVIASLVFLGSDIRLEGGQVWALALDRDICPPGYTVIIVPPNADLTPLWDEKTTLQLFQDAFRTHEKKCPPFLNSGQQLNAVVFASYRANVAENAKKALQAGGALLGGDVTSLGLAAVSWTGGTRFYDNSVAQKHDQLLAKEAQERARQQELTKQRAAEDAKRAFNDQAAMVRAKFAEAAGVRTDSPDFGELWANPFPYVGKVVHYRTDFIRMQTATEGIFNDRQAFVVKDMPEGVLRRPGPVIIAGKVLGNTRLGEGAAAVQVPSLAYTNVHICNTHACEEYFGRRD